MSPYRALILDLDGTVIDSHRYTFDAFRFACTPVREPPRDAEVFAAFGPSERVILEGLLPPAQVDAAYARLQAYYARHAAGIDMHPEMRPLLSDCRTAGVRVALFTGRGGDSTALLLSALDLEWAFAAVRAGDAVSRPKPYPDGVLELLAALDRSAGETIVVGDSRLDLEAAAAAGVDAMYAAWHAWNGARVPHDACIAAHPDALRPRLGLAPAAGSGHGGAAHAGPIRARES